MHYFTRAWCSENNDATAEAVREDYWRYLSMIADRLPAVVRQLAHELDLQDARPRGYAHDPVVGWLSLSLRTGDLQRGYENLTLTYWLAELKVLEAPELKVLAPVGELAIRFQALTYQRQPVATRDAP